jgi:EmrB/QacA subfamily drug resistance transporter
MLRTRPLSIGGIVWYKAETRVVMTTSTKAESKRLRIILGGVLSAFLAALDTTILATVMPTIVEELGGLSLYSWVFSVYMIMTAVSMPIWGRLCDLLGKRLLFAAAVVFFLFGSVLCGISQNMTQLIVFRGLQGIGAGGLSAVPFALISTVFPSHERGKALGVLASAWGISSIVGPLLGSLLVTSLHWRWVFYINLPIGAAGITLIWRHYTEVAPHRKEKIDYAGALFLACAIIALLLTFLQIGRGSGAVTAGVGVSCLGFVLFLALFGVQERRAESPLLELAFFRRRAFWVGNLLGFMASFAMYGILAYMPLFTQSVQGGTAVQAGLVITPMSLAWSASSVASGRLVSRIGENTMIRFGMALMAIGFLFALFIHSDSSILYLVLCVVSAGIGMGAQTPSLMLSVQHSLDQKNVGVATSTQMLARTIGGAVGVSLLGSILTGSMGQRIQELSVAGALDRFPETAKAVFGDPQKLLGLDIRPLLSSADLTTVLSVFTDALHTVFLSSLIMILAGLAVSASLPPSALHRIARPQEFHHD